MNRPATTSRSQRGDFVDPVEYKFESSVAIRRFRFDFSQLTHGHFIFLFLSAHEEHEQETLVFQGMYFR